MTRRLRVLVCVTALSAVARFAPPAAAQGAPSEQEVTVGTTTGSAPDVAVADDGSWTVVWYGSTVSTGGDGGSGIYSRTFSAAGVPSLPVRLDVAPDLGSSPVIAAEAAGYVVEWASAGSGTLSNITARRLNADGTPRGAPFRVVTGVSYLQAITLAAAPDGRFVTAWSNDAITAQPVSASDVPQGGPVQVAPPRSGLELGNSQPSVAMFTSGRFMVTWTYDSGAIGARNDIRARLYSAAGVPASAAYQVNAFSLKLQFDPSVSVNAASTSVVTWTSEDTATNLQDGSRSGVYGDFGGEFRLNDYITGPQYASDVAVASDGFIAVWTSDAQDGSGSGIYGARYKPNRVRVGTEFRVNTVTAGSQSSPAVAVSPDGHAVIVWVDANMSRVVAVRTRVNAAVAGEPAPGAATPFSVSPNPAGPLGCTAQFVTDGAGPVRLAVVDVLGREVRVVLDGPVAAGEHTVEIRTASLPAGTYALRLVRGATHETRLFTVTR